MVYVGLNKKTITKEITIPSNIIFFSAQCRNQYRVRINPHCLLSLQDPVSGCPPSKARAVARAPTRIGSRTRPIAQAVG